MRERIRIFRKDREGADAGCPIAPMYARRWLKRADWWVVCDSSHIDGFAIRSWPNYIIGRQSSDARGERDKKKKYYKEKGFPLPQGISRRYNNNNNKN